MISRNELKEFAAFARTTAHEAGKILLKKSRRRSKIILKGRVNLVTESDLASEEHIINAITKKFPKHSILAEEENAYNKDPDLKWVIDPLDGTTNYAHDFPFYCVSIALEHEGEIVVGAIYDPERDEMFYAFKGGGSFLNRKRISVSGQPRLESSLLATGFPYDIGSPPELSNAISSKLIWFHFVEYAGTAHSSSPSAV